LVWRRACHETLDESLVELGMPVQGVPEIIIAHLGYQDQKEKEAKARRNIAIMEAQGERDVATCAQMGDSYYVLGEWSQGLRCFTNAYVQDPTWKARLAEKILIGHLNLGHFLDAEEWLEAMPDGMGKRFWAGEIAWNRGQVEQALEWYQKALLCSPTISYYGSNEEALVHRAKGLLAAAGRGE
jgi:tetratricopeptide (TPR) repeat protein